ncbi:MAG TPA: aminodeoxychorismate/anthranilate synthase component II [Pirellulales bacterium]|jgi:anthranilate synthase/aminodeoxychorismate synthase-like glutamine amidotransferase|nr:aminodeoxychorismate/anthranilate synthase component II [Pirellulales bacterium]
MIVLLDNYDSFVYNLARYFQRLRQTTRVLRNDATTADELASLNPSAIVISPGPCTPRQAGCSLDVVRRLGDHIPILGICLGHQAIGEAFGGRVIRATEPVHGRSWQIFHHEHGLFQNLSSPMLACRYHSLVVERESLPDCLDVTAWTLDGTIMALEHREHCVVGLQFHPESILTEWGYPLIAAFLARAGIKLEVDPAKLSEEHVEPAPLAPLPTAPVTF